MTVDVERIDAVRAFNRFYTNRIGVLRSGLHGSPHPLPDARVLFELGRRTRPRLPTCAARSTWTPAS